MIVLQNTEQDKANRIDGKIGEHVDKPRWVNTVKALVEIIEDTTTRKKPQHGQCADQRIEPSACHPHVIEGKERGAVQIGKTAADLLPQEQKSETAKEKFLKQRIHKGNVQGNEEKIFCRYTDPVGERCANTREIDPRAQGKIRAEDDAKHRKTELSTISAVDRVEK